MREFVAIFAISPLDHFLTRSHYSRTCIKRHRNKHSPCVKRAVFKVPKCLPLYYCNFQVSMAVTSVKRSRSPFTEFKRPVWIVLNLSWTITHSNRTNNNRSNLTHIYLPKSTSVVIWIFVYLVVKCGIIRLFYCFFVTTLFCENSCKRSPRHSPWLTA